MKFKCEYKSIICQIFQKSKNKPIPKICKINPQHQKKKKKEDFLKNAHELENKYQQHYNANYQESRPTQEQKKNHLPKT